MNRRKMKCAPSFVHGPVFRQAPKKRDVDQTANSNRFFPHSRRPTCCHVWM